MKEVFEYILAFCQAEQKTRQLDRDSKQIQEFNEQLDKMESYAALCMRDSFGLLHRDEALMEFLNEDPFADFPVGDTEIDEETQAFIDQIDTRIKKRIIFKIAAYPEQIYLVYTSVANPQGNRYGECLVVDNKLETRKIIAKYFLASEDGLTYEWRLNAGNAKEFQNQDKPMQVEKYQTPDAHEVSLKIHQAD